MTNQYNPAAGLLVPVEGIGVFTFSMRTMRNQMAIECEYARQTEGLTNPTAFLGNLATRLSDLIVLIAAAPDGWSPEDVMKMDAWDEDTYANIDKVWSALRDKEAEFRGRVQPQSGSPATDEQDESVVPAPIQPPSD